MLLAETSPSSGTASTASVCSSASKSLSAKKLASFATTSAAVTTSITWSASCTCSRARCTPIISTVSWVSRSPAVSTSWRGMPSTLISTFNRSLVVPGTSVTIAASSPANMLRILDLPTLGLPTNATVIPCASLRPCSACTNSALVDVTSVSRVSPTLACSSISISSSGKSMAASISTRKPSS